MDLLLFPYPQSIKIKGPACHEKLSGHIRCSNSFSTRLQRRITELIPEFQEVFDESVSIGGNEDADCFLSVIDKEGLPSQGYELKISEGRIVLSASDEPGAFYAIQTLRQLIRNCGMSLPDMEICDFPDFPARGYMLDISRGKIPLQSELIQLVRRLAELKYNQLQLYMENAFAYPGYRDVWKDVSPMTPQEILELDEVCAEYYIQLVPNQNSFGHMERWLMHDSCRHLAETPHGFTQSDGRKWDCGKVLRPDETSLAFLDSLYRELLPNFRSPLFNVGCDETYELGMGYSRESCKRYGKETVYFNFLLKIYDLVRKHGKQMMFWGDIILHHPKLIERMPRDIIVLNWGYAPDHPFREECRKFAEAGIPFYVCPGTSAWNCETPSADFAFLNLRNASQNGFANGASGYLLTDWGDNGNYQYPVLSYAGIVAAACFSWSARNISEDKFKRGVDLIFCGNLSCGLGEFLEQFGNAASCLGGHRYREIFHNLLIGNWNGINRVIDELDDGKMQTAINFFDRLLNELPKLPLSFPGGELLKSELCQNVKQARLGAKVGRLHFGGLKGDAVPHLKAEYRELMLRHSELWLRRNRPGGLPRSLTFMQNGCKSLETVNSEKLR